jgi:hypothetical protein
MHARFDLGSFAATVHRELFEETVRLPRREPLVGQRHPHGLGRHINEREVVYLDPADNSAP